MAYILEVPNPFEPLKNLRKSQHPGGITVREWLRQEKGPDFVEFDVPTICIVNGEALMRDRWDTEIQKDDIINFVSLPQGPFIILAIVLVAVIALTLVVLTPTPTTPGETPASDPVFTLKGQQNEVRLGEPIEVCYGRNRIYPSMASRPYYQYQDNEQFQYSLFCLGQGEYDIDQILISDTDISSYQEVQVEVVPPGSLVTLFPTNVFTSPEAGGQTLFAPNELEYVAPGWVGPFVTNPAGTTSTEIQLDVVFPKGLYSVEDDGTLDSRSVTIEAEYQEIDDVGAPLGSFNPLPGFPTTVAAATTTPQRRSFSSPVTEARYQVRLRRTSAKDLGTRSGNDLVWEGMRAYLTVTQSWGNVTLLAVIIQATNNLNAQSQFKFNVIATRRLPTFSESGGWSDPSATRSIVWALVDVFRSRYGARVQSDSFFDWDALAELDAFYTGRGEFFDWIFRDPISVWEAAQTIARVGRAVPLLSGSLITMRRDGPLTVPVTMFTPDNILKDTFEWDVKLWDIDEFDSVSMEYTEPATGYKQEQVLATLPGGTTDNSQDIRLAGCQDRAQAFREALFLLATQYYVRENIIFETGLEGFVATYGDLIAVSHDAPNWGQAGYVVHADTQSDGFTRLYLSEPLRWHDSGEYQLLLRGRRGETVGPFTAYQTTDDKQVLIVLDSSDEVDFLLGGETEPMLFLFGVIGNITQMCKITMIEPQGGEVIRITAVNDAPIIHSFDGLSVPPLETIPVPPLPPDLPIVGPLYITQVAGTVQIVQVAWLAAFGAQYYLVETSEDNVLWQEKGTVTRTAIQFQVRAGPLYVRVAAVNNGRGPWSSGTVNIAHILSLDITGDWLDLEWTVQWFEVLNVTGYQVQVFDNSASAPVLRRTETIADRSYLYDYTKALVDSNLVRDMRVEVDPVFASGPSGSPTGVDLHNDVPSPPTSPGSSHLSTESGGELFRLSWVVPHENDLITVKIWTSVVSGFDPNVEVPVFSETVSAPGWPLIPTSYDLLVPFESPGGTPDTYWRVGLFDVWGDEIGTNLTGEQTIAGIP